MTAPAAERGRLSVDDAVVEKVAALAAADSGDVLRRRSLRGSNERGVQAVADVRGGTARLTVTVTLRYPCDTREVLEGVRSRVRASVLDLTGVTVTNLRVDVAGFAGPEGRR